MSRVAAVAWREFKQTVFRKVFLLAVIGIPILVMGAMALSVFLIATQKQPALIGSIAIVESTGELVEATRAEFDPERIEQDRHKQIEEQAEQAQRQLAPGAPGIDPGTTTFDMGLGTGEVDVDIEGFTDPDEAAVDELRRRVQTGELIAAVFAAAEVLETPGPEDDEPRFEMFVGDEVDIDHTGFIERRIGQAVVRVRAERADLDPDEAVAMLRRPDAETKRILADGTESSENEDAREFLARMIPMVFMMLVWIGVFTSAQHLMMTTIEEKSNRVMELLLSAVSPLQLMLGKILGMGGVGLLIVGIYSSVGIAALIGFAATQYIEWIDIVYLFVFYIMAYFMIAAIMAAVGSAVSDIREANTLVTPVMFIVMVPLFLWFPITNSPNGTIAEVFSFIPPATPFVMILRLSADEAVTHPWQIPASIIWGYICVLGMIWFAAKVFRVGVLMYGKPPSPLQLIKWARYS